MTKEGDITLEMLAQTLEYWLAYPFKTVNRHLVLSKESWKKVRVYGYNFTDEELDAADKHDKGYIGESMGVDCYIYRKFTV